MPGGFGFARMLGFDERFQVVQTVNPENAVLLDPRIDRAQRFGVELINTVAPFPVLSNQVRSPQKAKMLGNRWTRNRKRAGNLPGRLRTTTEQVEHRAPGGVGEGLECSFRGP